MTVGLLMSIAAVLIASSIASGLWSPRAWLAATVAGGVLTAAAALSVLFGASDWEWRSDFAVCGELVHLRLDGLGAWFLVLVGVVVAAGAVYAHEYWSDRRHPVSAPRGRLWWSVLAASLVLVLVSSNGLHFLIGWELFTLSAYFLITLDRQRAQVRAAGWLYLVASHVGTVCLFAFFGALAARTGSWELGPMVERAELAPLFWLAMIGFGLKSGVFPLHVWLPSAHANAPSHVSAILSGVTIKMGIYGLLRFSGWLPLPSAVPWVVIGFGAVSAVIGIAFAFAQDDLKRLLAYCSVENVGVILVGVGLALLAATHGDAAWGRLALAGALLHVWNHGAFKTLLFFGAGSVLHATGTREMSRLGGLWRAMPWTASAFAIGTLAVTGLPPLNGFVSEWLVYLGLFDASMSRGPVAWAALPAALAMAMAGALALATFVKASSMVFLGAPRTDSVAAAHECGPWMRGPMIAMASVCVTLAIAPALVWPAVTRATQAWRPQWAATVSDAPLAVIGTLQASLIVVAALAVVLLTRKVIANGRRRSLTWDCGYAAPTARMQYTSGSFASIVGTWFAWILRPEVRSQSPRSVLGSNASREERIPETVLERVFVPVGDAVLRVSSVARRLQHGRLQAYILYLLVGLVALACIVAWGGAS